MTRGQAVWAFLKKNQLLLSVPASFVSDRSGALVGASLKKTGQKMIELYFWPTPNGHKISIALEEMGLAYQLRAVNINKGDQFDPAFLAFSPNNRMPAIKDPDGPEGQPVTIFESGAILQYLAEKTGQFAGQTQRQRIAVTEWLMWQMGGFGPMLGQAHHFIVYAKEKLPYAMERYGNEANRLYGVLDRRLAENEFVAGDFYSIADMAILPWTRTYERQNVDIEAYPNVQRWRGALLQRPAVLRGMKAGAEMRDELAQLSDADWQRLFGISSSKADG
jgi:GST-like protein